jgi:hypothetical protein
VHAVTPTGRALRAPAVAIPLIVAVLMSVLAITATSAHADPTSGCNPLKQTCGVGVGGGGSPGGPGNGGGGPGNGGGGPVTAGCHNTDPTGNGCDPCYSYPNGTPLNPGVPSDPAACTVYSQNLFCSQQNPAGTGADPATWVAYLKAVGCYTNPYRPGSAAVAAEKAYASIHFPSPTGDRSPRQTLSYQGYPFTYVNLWTWYWTDPSTWVKLTATASDGDQSATVTATPVELDFSPGDGGAAVACDGPGRPWVAADGNGAPTDGGCAYQYSKVSSGPITSTQTIVWQITWKGTGGTAGEIPSLSTSTSGQLQVLQVQVVNR